LSNYVGGLSGSTVNTASDFNAALQYILDNNSGKHFYYGTDHAGTTWYFASDTELSTLSNDSYTCGNGVQNNGTTVKESFNMFKYVEPGPSPADQFQHIDLNGYKGRLSGDKISTVTGGLMNALQKIIDINPGSKFYEGTDSTGTQYFFASNTVPDTSTNSLTFNQGACLGGGDTAAGTYVIFQTFTLTKV